MRTRLYEVAGMLDLTRLWQLADLDRPDLRTAPWSPVIPPRLQPIDDGRAGRRLRAIRQGDLLVHHPVRVASPRPSSASSSRRPTIPTSLRSSRRCTGRRATRGPIVQHLIRAAERGQAGRGAGRDQGALRRGGEHRVGTQAGAGGAPRRVRPGRPEDALPRRVLVVRREGRSLRRYVHIGTGNYNTRTVAVVRRPRPALCRTGAHGADVSDLFNILTGSRGSERSVA